MSGSPRAVSKKNEARNETGRAPVPSAFQISRNLGELGEGGLPPSR
jgi:hypothetical protein